LFLSPPLTISPIRITYKTLLLNFLNAIVEKEAGKVHGIFEPNENYIVKLQAF
jgi:hypothetical protein